MSMSQDDAAKAFLKLVATGDMAKVRHVLAQAPQFVNIVGPHPFWGGRPQPLHVSIESNQTEMFHLLLEAGADVNGSNGEYDGWSPLMLAVHKDPMRDELHRRGARVGLMEALLLADDRQVEALLQDGELPAQVPNGGSVLNFARTTYAIERLMELGAPVEVKDRWGRTPMASISALGLKGRPLVWHLVGLGVAATAVDYARIGDRDNIPEEACAEPEVIVAAVEFGHQELVEWLLDSGADPNARSSERPRQTVLHIAAWNGNLALAKLLVEAGADIAALDEEHSSTPRGWAETAITVKNNPLCREVADYLAGLEA